MPIWHERNLDGGKWFRRFLNRCPAPLLSKGPAPTLKDAPSAANLSRWVFSLRLRPGARSSLHSFAVAFMSSMNQTKEGDFAAQVAAALATVRFVAGRFGSTERSPRKFGPPRRSAREISSTESPETSGEGGIRRTTLRPKATRISEQYQVMNGSSSTCTSPRMKRASALEHRR